MSFVKVKAQASSEAHYETTINVNYINYVTPSSHNQVGRAIIRLAGTDGNRVNIAAMDSLPELHEQHPNLVAVQVFGTALGNIIGPALVNLERVMRIEQNRDFFVLHFEDGDQLVITDSPI